MTSALPGATTHCDDHDRLLEIDSSVQLQLDPRYVDTGDIITAAGVSAGIDMALHLIVRLHSEDRAREIKRGIQYEPEPQCRTWRSCCRLVAPVR